MTSKSEANIQREIMLALSAAGETVWRNNTGVAWNGDEIIWRGRDIIIKNARPIRFGLCEGGYDLIGIRTVLIQPEHIGKKLGVFVGTEVKTEKGRLRPKQIIFGRVVEERGGIARIARSVADLDL